MVSNNLKTVNWIYYSYVLDGGINQIEEKLILFFVKRVEKAMLPRIILEKRLLVGIKHLTMFQVAIVKKMC